VKLHYSVLAPLLISLATFGIAQSAPAAATSPQSAAPPSAPTTPATPSGQSATAPAAPAAASDESQVVDAVRTMYAAASTDDLALFNSVVTSDFYAFDNGKRFDGEGLMKLVRSMHAAGKIYVWNVTEPEVHIAGKYAWITYTNRGSVRDASGAKNLTWLESAFLEKQDGVWKIRFFHSTRAA
jgi:hypothetical protein